MESLQQHSQLLEAQFKFLGHLRPSPPQAAAKRHVGTELNSAEMHADAKQTDFCVYLSAILLLGLALMRCLGGGGLRLWHRVAVVGGPAVRGGGSCGIGGLGHNSPHILKE